MPTDKLRSFRAVGGSDEAVSAPCRSTVLTLRQIQIESPEIAKGIRFCAPFNFGPSLIGPEGWVRGLDGLSAIV